VFIILYFTGCDIIIVTTLIKWVRQKRQSMVILLCIALTIHNEG
jgi:hypothetical protein